MIGCEHEDLDPTGLWYEDGTNTLFALAPETMTETRIRGHFEHFPLRCVMECFVAPRRIRVGAFGPWLESGTRLWALPGLGYDDVRYDWIRVVWP